MDICEISLYKAKIGSKDEYPTVFDCLAATKHLLHAGKQELDYLLTHENHIPTNYKGTGIHRSTPLFFGGTIMCDERDNQYIHALYHKHGRGWVTERYWLSYPLPPNAYFATVT